MHVDFSERFVETLIRYGVDPMWIHLEVTESAVIGIWMQFQTKWPLFLRSDLVFSR